jgi:predicted O-methyltransferase YrrM
MIQVEKNRLEFLKEILGQVPNGKGIEVGTFKGELSKEILSMWTGTLYMLDVWRPLDAEYIDSSNHGNFKDGVYADAMANIIGLEDRAVMIRCTSEVGSDIFSDESLDFAYIDANHAYDFVKQDIELWWPKVKKGGWLCGHDFLKIDWWNDTNFYANGIDKHIWSNEFYHGLFGVNPAVEEFCKETGNNAYITNEFFGSWFVRKK